MIISYIYIYIIHIHPEVDSIGEFHTYSQFSDAFCLTSITYLLQVSTHPSHLQGLFKAHHLERGSARMAIYGHLWYHHIMIIMAIIIIAHSLS